MPLEEPSWWYGAPNNLRQTIITTALKPLASLYAAAARHRLRKASPAVAGLPVICIGNFTAGGTGKTPTALYVAKLLHTIDETPAFLSRGFGGKLKGPHWINQKVDSAANVGDEPLLLVGNAPTLIAKDRAKGADAIVRSAPGPHQPTVIVMDDGLQNPSLHKNLSIAVVDGRRGFGNNRVIPAGPLRAPLESQLPLVDIIIVNAGSAGQQNQERASAIAAQLKKNFSGPVFIAAIRATGDTRWLTAKPVFAFAGIGAPDRFFDMLEQLGSNIIGRKSFKDHHTYSEGDAADLLQQANAHGAQLVTTQKDLVRLAGSPSALTALRNATRALPIALQLPKDQEAELVAILQSCRPKQ